MKSRLLTALLTPVLLLTVHAAPSLARLAPSDVFDLRTVADAQISPDGKRVVYAVHFADVMTDRRYSNLWIINFDGTGNRPLTTGNFSDTSPRWSPDGNRLAYLSDREGPPQIFIHWMDTGQSSKVTNLQQPPSALSWSPDGRQIAFIANVPELRRKLGISMPTPPPGARWAEPPKIIDKMVYRFNGTGYLTPGYTQVFTVATDGRTPRQISSGNFQHGTLGGPSPAPAWSPDGKSILLSANRHDDAEYAPMNTDIYEFSVTDGGVKELTNRKGPDSSPAISPDGRHIAYTGFDDRFQGHQTTKLYLMNRDGSNSRMLSTTLDRDVESPQWAPDGRGVYFLYGDQGDTKIGYYPIDGPMKSLGGGIGSGLSSYSGGASLSIAHTGAFATTSSRPDVPGDVAVGTLQSSGLRTITAINRDLLSQRKLGAVEEIWYASSKDGRKLEGWIVKPPDFDPSRKYPLILEIHGGPFANYGAHFDVEKQLFAARDYVVLYTNPRGSTSYGEEFGNMIHHAYPGDDFYDLNSGVDAVIAKGYIDPGQLFVTGGSGGGVLTCWMVGRSDRFRAAASLYPVINWYSFVLTADIGPRVSNYWFAGAPWDHTENYEKRSLLSVVKNVKTPTMVMTGEEDYRTPISEAEQYYRALKMLKVDTVMVRVPEEPHGISKRPSHHIAKVLYIIDWFDQHRKE